MHDKVVTVQEEGIRVDRADRMGNPGIQGWGSWTEGSVCDFQGVVNKTG